VRHRFLCRGEGFAFFLVTRLAPTTTNLLSLIPKIILLTLIFFSAIPAYAQDSAVSDDEVNAVARRMYCPECENIPLDVCGTQACIQWREEIRAQLEAGSTEEQVIADFVSRFGDRVVGTPQDPVLRALSLITPWLVGLVMFVIVATLLLRWRRSGKSKTTFGIPTVPNGNSPTLTDDDYRQRIERDLLARR
jgi:cytochrome c-type biogenesis protein CcmH